MPSRSSSPACVRALARPWARLYGACCLGLLLTAACGSELAPRPDAAVAPHGDGQLTDAQSSVEPIDTAAPSDAESPDATQPPPPDGSAPTDRVLSFADPPRTMHVVAHQDDDLGLMNPNLLNTIARGHEVMTVFLTDGSAGLPCGDYALSRAQGSFAAYAQMAGVPNQFEPLHEQRIGDKTVLVTRLMGAPVTLVFMGFTNAPVDAASDLPALWDGTLPSIETSLLDGRQTVDSYTREALIETLKLLIEQFAPAHLNTLDASQLQPAIWPFDHPEHVASALFALAAAQRARPRPTMRMYRAYNIQLAPANVAKEDVATKGKVLSAYSPFDDKICSSEKLQEVHICGIPQLCDLPALLYKGYDSRQYAVGFVHAGTGAISGPGNNCLEANAPTVRLASCELSRPTQRWSVRADGTIRSGTDCLSKLDARVQVQPCTGSAAQQFSLTTQGQLRGPDASCVDAQQNELTLAACALVERQLGFGLLFASPMRAVAGPAQAASSPALEPLALGYLTNRAAHACERRPDGVYCARYRAESAAFDGFTRLSERFSDADGFGAAAYGSSLQLADLDGDGRSEVCARGEQGLFCAQLSSDGSSFVNFARRSAGDSFSDAAGYAAARSYYGSLRLVDISGDGRADLCARSARGVECALNDGGGRLGAPSLYSDAFSDEAGYAGDAYGSTLMFGDVNGDRRNDVCARHVLGVRCALNDGRGQFVLEHAYSHPGELSDEAGFDKQRYLYGSLRLSDVDGDGRADLCGNSSTGLRCGLSVGNAFGYTLPVLAPMPALDPAWRVDSTAGSLGFGDLNGDGHADLCLRAASAGASTIYCASAP